MNAILQSAAFKFLSSWKTLGQCVVLYVVFVGAQEAGWMRAMKSQERSNDVAAQDQRVLEMIHARAIEILKEKRNGLTATSPR